MSDQKRIVDQAGTLNSDDVLELSASDESEPEGLPSIAPFDPELDHSDDDDDDGDEAAAPTAQSTFTLTGGNSAFSNRSRGIFDCLDSVDRKTVSSLNQGRATNSRKTTCPPSTCPTPPKKRGVPDYMVHPERWTHYSLEDVTESSDQDNRRTAHQFLSSLRKETNPDFPSDIQQKMVFSRPNRPLKDHVAAQLSPDQGKEKRLQLSHLAEEEEDEEGRRREETREQPVQKNEQQKDKEKGECGAVDPAEEGTVEESNLGFTSFRKTKSKNYRRSSGCVDD